MSTPSIAQLKTAIQIAEKIESLQTELNRILGHETTNGRTAAPKKVAAAPRAKRKGKRTMSPEARERIAAAQRARWAKFRKG